MRMSDLVAKYITEIIEILPITKVPFLPEYMTSRTAVRKFSEMNLREILVVCQVK
jgi:hypothetical protein